MTQARGRRSSSRGARTSAPRRRMFWNTGSLADTTLTAGSSNTVDLMDNVTVGDRSALRRMTALRLLFKYEMHSTAIDQLLEVDLGVTEILTSSLAAGEFPGVGSEEVGMYLAADGIQHFNGKTAASYHLDFDIRTKRVLRGSDRTLAAIITNAGAVSFTFSFSLRILIAYG